MRQANIIIFGFSGKINEFENEIRLVKGSISIEILTAESMTAADKIEISDLYSLDSVREVLARFWFFCAKTDSNKDNTPRYLAKAERIAEDCSSTSLYQDISAFRIESNEKNEEGQHFNLVLETLNQFCQDKNLSYRHRLYIPKILPLKTGGILKSIN